MAIRIYSQGQWQECELKAKNGAVYTGAKLKRRNADGWDKIYPEKENYLAVFPVAKTACYSDSIKLYEDTIWCGNNKNADSSFSHWTMLNFNVDFTEELKNAELIGARLYLRRQNSSSSYDRTYVNVWLHKYHTAPNLCDERDYSQGALAIDSVQSFAIGEGRWLELKTSVAEKLRSGEYCGLSIGLGETDKQYYDGYYSAKDCKLEIACYG